MQEGLLIFQNSVVSTPSEDYEISGDFEVRVLQDGELVRVKGITVDGYPYYTYQRMIDDEPKLFGKIFIDGKPIQVVYKAILVQTAPQIETVKKKQLKMKHHQKRIITIEQPLFAYSHIIKHIVTKRFMMQTLIHIQNYSVKQMDYLNQFQLMPQ